MAAADYLAAAIRRMFTRIWAGIVNKRVPSAVGRGAWDSDALVIEAQVADMRMQIAAMRERFSELETHFALKAANHSEFKD